MSGVAAGVRNGLRLRGRSKSRPKDKPVEFTLLLTATMCLLTFGAVMVFSASSSASMESRPSPSPNSGASGSIPAGSTPSRFSAATISPASSSCSVVWASGMALVTDFASFLARARVYHATRARQRATPCQIPRTCSHRRLRQSAT